MQLAERSRSRSWTPLSYAAAVAASIAAAWLVSTLLPNHLVFLSITVVISAIALLGVGMVTGSAGMIALCQMSFAAVGAWTVTKLSSIDAPGGLVSWMLVGACAAAAVGLVIGLPALRLRGVNLAVVTLGFAAAVDVTLVKYQFPGAAEMLWVSRPDAFATDRAYLLLALIVLALVGTAAEALQRGRLGAGWRTVAFSERAVAGSGTSVANVKLLAFSSSAGIAGISGGLLVGQLGSAYPASFSTLQSLALYLLSIIVGTQFVGMALLAGLVMVAIPEQLKRYGLSQDWGLVLFGVTSIPALASGSTLAEQLSGLLARARRSRRGPEEAARSVIAFDSDQRCTTEAEAEARGPAVASGPLLEVRNVTVTFGAVTALDGVDLDVPVASIVGLIGPNGAGKSTLVDAVTGFLPRASGSVALGGSGLGHLPPHLRARRGLRRTFQQARVPSQISVGGYVAFVARGRSSREEIATMLDQFRCPPASSRLGDADVATRRLVEVVAQLCAKPAVLLLDEPAAGLSHEDRHRFGERLRQVPGRYGVSILLIEHDLELVRVVCDQVVVLDFGTVIATGPPEAVLSTPAVLEAYLGEVGSL